MQFAMVSYFGGGSLDNRLGRYRMTARISIHLEIASRSRTRFNPLKVVRESIQRSNGQHTARRKLRDDRRLCEAKPLFLHPAVHRLRPQAG